MLSNFKLRRYPDFGKALRVSPAMAAGLTDTIWSMEDIAERVDVRVNAPKARGTYGKRN